MVCGLKFGQCNAKESENPPKDNLRSKRADPRKSKRIEDLLRRARNKGHLFKYAAKLKDKLMADEDRHIGPNQVHGPHMMSS